MSAPTHPAVARVEVIALVASAGGLEALSAVLRTLPEDLPAAVVVAQHLGGQGSRLVEILGRRIALPVAWARDGEPIRSGCVTVCPPRSGLEILPDCTCSLAPAGTTTSGRPLDALLSSLADSFGANAAAVVLTGMGSDAAAGAVSLRDAGGLVVVQSEVTAEQPAMPRAVIAADAAGLVLDLNEIGPVLVDAALGRPLPRPRVERDAISDVFGVEGEVAALAREIDWSSTALGPVTGWSPALRGVLRLMMESPRGMSLMWGPQYLLFYNDAAIPTIKPGFLGRSELDAYPELREHLDAIFEEVRAGRSLSFEAQLLPFEMDGRIRDLWFDVTYSPVREADGTVGGVLATFIHRTYEVLAARRLATLNALAAAPRGAGRHDALEQALTVLGASGDVLFAVAYLLDGSGTRAGMVASAGVEEGSAMAPRAVGLASGGAWPLQQLRDTREPVLVDDLAARLRGHRVGAEGLEPEVAWVHPLRDDAQDEVIGALILGVHPKVILDERLREFLGLAGDTVSARVAEAHARRREQQRLAQLAELDRAKTEFFSNVSHEFRTPLTLMLGPLDEALEGADGLPPGVADKLAVVRRNARRLLRLTGALLDFSQVEAGRLRANFAPADLAGQTGDIVSQFRSAVERAGLQLTVSIEPLAEPVWLDAEMWEKIVSNLLSNALKFTWEGEIEVALRKLPKHAELIVRDTGVGIPEEELPFIFKRFHRVRDARARTHEGAGIGLALVNELVRRHHGRIRATSTVGAGTTFTVWLPLGPRPVDQERTGRPAPSGARVAEAMAEEASRWAGDARLRDEDAAEGDAFDVPAPSSLRSYATETHILVVDDNPDMRDYLARLLSPRWQVTVAGDGEEALALARSGEPDLVVADVMMPGLDGFALLKALREEEGLRRMPVILVTARAGEESAIEGLLAGADDYIVKPFSAREMLARVGAQLDLARLRRRETELNAFRVQLADGLRALEDPVEIKRLACRMLVELFASEQAHFAEIDPEAQEFLVEGNYGIPTAFEITGRFPVAAFEPPASHVQAGERFVVENVETDPRLPPETRESYLALRTRASATVPIMREGEFCGLLSVDQYEPRAWTEEELALMEEVAGRTWAEVERARAQKALRDSEARLQLALDSARSGTPSSSR